MLLDDGQLPHYIVLSGTSPDYALDDLVALPVFCYFSFSVAFSQILVGQMRAVTMSYNDSAIGFF